MIDPNFVMKQGRVLDETIRENARLNKRIAKLREALGVMLDHYWEYRKNDGAWEFTDEIAQKYQDELVEGGGDEEDRLIKKLLNEPQSLRTAKILIKEIVSLKGGADEE